MRDLYVKLAVVAGLAAVAALTVPGLGTDTVFWLQLALGAIWLILAIEFGVSLGGRGPERVPAAQRVLDLANIALPAAALVLGFGAGTAALLCGLWVLRLVRNTEAVLLIGRVFAAEGRNLLGLMWLFGTVLFSAALIAYVLERDSQPQVFGSIPAAMWWAVVTLTTTGYGDAIPQSFAGRILSGVVMTAGIAVFALGAGILATGFAEELRRRDLLHNWALVRRVPLFAKLPADVLIDIVRVLRPKQFSPGAKICRAGDPGDQMYFITDGRVEVAAAEPIALGPGDFVGEIALVTGEPRNATVTAKTTVSVLVLHASDFHQLMAQSPEASDVIAKVVANRRNVSKVGGA